MLFILVLTQLNTVSGSPASRLHANKGGDKAPLVESPVNLCTRVQSQEHKKMRGATCQSYLLTQGKKRKTTAHEHEVDTGLATQAV
mmetsp:Transcript_44237/g.117240  ORF Transcript_44237/g.117240 Transcript_44237/m.117240 type:complete len:86 (-) Transcript_44237:2285-2542(-)